MIANNKTLSDVKRLYDTQPKTTEWYINITKNMILDWIRKNISIGMRVCMHTYIYIKQKKKNAHLHLNYYNDF